MATSYYSISHHHLAEHLIYLSTASSFWFSVNSSYDHGCHLSKRMGISPQDYEHPLSYKMGLLHDENHLIAQVGCWLLLHHLSSCRRLVLLSCHTLVLSSSSHCAALSPSHRSIWLLRRLSLRCRLVLSLSSRCTALSSSNRAGWLLHHLSLRHRLILSSHSPRVVLSSSHCAALSLSNCTGWLLPRLSSRRRLVLSSSSHSQRHSGCPR